MGVKKSLYGEIIRFHARELIREWTLLIYIYSVWLVTYAVGRTYVCTASFFCVFNLLSLDRFLLICQLNESCIHESLKEYTVNILSTPSGWRLFQIYCIYPSFVTVGKILSSRFAFPEFNVYKIIFFFCVVSPFFYGHLSLLKENIDLRCYDLFLYIFFLIHV